MTTEMIYSQWFDRLRQNLISSGFEPIDRDDDDNNDILLMNEPSNNNNTKKRPITKALPPLKGVAPTTTATAQQHIAKRQKTSAAVSVSATASVVAAVPNLEKEDEGWIDELFQLDAQGIDVSPLSSLCEKEVDDVATTTKPQPELAQQQQQHSMLYNVVDDVLAELTSDEEDSLLGEFSQSFLEEDKTTKVVVQQGRQEQQQYQAEGGDFFSSSFQQTTIPSLEEILPAPIKIPSMPMLQQQELQQPQREGDVYDPYPLQPPPSSVAPTTTKPSSSSSSPDCFSPPEGMSEVESTKFTIDSVRKCEEPMLLTLTSFPFRVLYANQAYQNMTGNNTSIIGKTFYDIFVNEGKEAPSFGACNGLLGNYQQDIVRVQSSSSSSCAEAKKKEIYSTTQIRPILKKAGKPDAGLRYYAVTLKELQVQNDSSIVYLPMPSGSMVKF